MERNESKLQVSKIVKKIERRTQREKLFTGLINGIKWQKSLKSTLVKTKTNFFIR